MAQKKELQIPIIELKDLVVPENYIRFYLKNKDDLITMYEKIDPGEEMPSLLEDEENYYSFTASAVFIYKKQRGE